MIFQRKFIVLISIIILTYLAYFNSMTNGFVFDDDNVYIVRSTFIKNFNNISKIFTKDYFNLAKERTFRPVHTLTYFLDYKLWKLNQVGWHLSLILFHSLNGILIYFLLSLVLKEYQKVFTVSLFTSLLFVLHPVHTEIMNCFTFGRYTICLTFTLLSFIFHIKHRFYKKNYFYFFSVLFYIIAILIREIAIPLLIIMIFYDFSFLRNSINYKTKYELFKKYFFYYFPYIIFIILWYFSNRVYFKPIVIVRGLDNFSPHYLHNKLSSTIFTMSKIFVYYLWILLLPLKQVLIPGGDTLITISDSILNLKVFLSIMILIVILYFAIRNYLKTKEMSFSIFFFFIFLLPVANIIPFWSIMAERYLYFSSIGFFMALSLLLTKIKNNVVFYLLSVIILIFYFNKTISRNKDWHNGTILWNKTVKALPDSFMAHNSLGVAYLNNKDYSKALLEFENVIKLNPTFAEAYINTGLIEHKNGRFDNALIKYQEAIKLKPDFTIAHNNLGYLYFQMGKYDKALAEYKTVLKLEPGFTMTYHNLELLQKEITQNKKKQFYKISDEIKKLSSYAQ